MVVGHTMFALDGCFGLLKRMFWKTDVSSLAAIEQVVQSSLEMNETGEVIVPVRDWAD